VTINTRVIRPAINFLNLFKLSCVFREREMMKGGGELLVTPIMIPRPLNPDLCILPYYIPKTPQGSIEKKMKAHSCKHICWDCACKVIRCRSVADTVDTWDDENSVCPFGGCEVFGRCGPIGCYVVAWVDCFWVKMKFLCTR